MVVVHSSCCRNEHDQFAGHTSVGFDEAEALELAVAALAVVGTARNSRADIASRAEVHIRTCSAVGDAFAAETVRPLAAGVCTGGGIAAQQQKHTEREARTRERVEELAAVAEGSSAGGIAVVANIE